MCQKKSGCIFGAKYDIKSNNKITELTKNKILSILFLITFYLI